MKYQAPYFRALILLLSTVAISACGNAISTLQEFFPNDPPVIDTETITITDTDGNSYDRANIVRNSSYKLSIQARDPEKTTLTYSFASAFGATSQFEQTDTGCSVVFTVTTMPGEAGTALDAPIILNMTVRDIKGASASTAIDIGTRRATPPLILSAITPSSVRNDTTATFTFSTQSDGWFQIIENAATSLSAAEAEALMTTATRYTSGDSIAATVAGPAYAGTVDAKTVKVSAGDAPKKIWVLFRDNNNSYTCAYAVVTLDTTAPTVTGTTPAHNATGISTSPVVEINFSEPMDTGTLNDALTLSGGAGSVAYNTVSGTTARYTASGLAKNTTYTATIAGAKDVAGNMMAGKTITFTTTPTYALTYDANGGSSGPSSISYEKDELVTVSATEPTRPGYTFNGWKDSTGTSFAPGTTFPMPAKDVTLYAQWVLSNYSVTYNANANGTVTGTLPAEIASYTMNESYTVKPFPVATGVVTSNINDNGSSYYFDGWNTQADGNGENRQVGSTYQITAPGNITLYAKWREFSLRDIGPNGGWVYSVDNSYSIDGYKYSEAYSEDVSTRNSNPIGWLDPGFSDYQKIHTNLVKPDGNLAQGPAVSTKYHFWVNHYCAGRGSSVVMVLFYTTTDPRTPNESLTPLIGNSDQFGLVVRPIRRF